MSQSLDAAHHKPLKASRDALALVALYAVLAGLWIGLSDSVVAILFAPDIQALALAQSVKGAAFVLVTTLLLFVAAQRAFRRRDRLVKQLAVSEATYHALVEGQANPMLLAAPDLSILYGNLAGLACFPGAAHRLSDLFTPEMLNQLCAQLALLEPSQPMVRVDLPASGDGRWYAWTARAVFDDEDALLHYQLSGHDITSHRRSEESFRATRDCLETAIAARTGELGESNHRLRDFAAVSSDWLWETNAKGQITFLSESFPWAGQESLGQQLLSLPPWRLQDGTAEENERMLAFAAGHQPFRDIERILAGADGVPRYFKIKANPLFGDNGRLLGWRGVGLDVTERKLAQMALAAAHDELEQRVRDRTLALEQEVIERERAEGELARDRALLRCLLDSIPDLIFFKDPDSIYLGGNSAFCTFVGRTEDDFVGLSDLDIFLPEIGAFFQSQDRQMFAEGRARNNEEWVDYPDGRRVLLDTMKTPYFGPAGELLGLVGISRDITRRKLAEDALRGSEERFRQLVEDVDAIAWEWDVGARRFCYVSPQGLRLTGFSAEQWCAADFWLDHIHPDDREQAAHMRDTAGQEGQNHDSEYRLLRADGSVLWLRDIVHVHSEGGQPRRLRGLMIDVTDRKLVEAQMIQTSKLATLGEMAAGMAHELNQPLNIIRMAADARLMDIADEIDDPPAIKGSLETVAQQCGRMADIIAHTREFSRSEDDLSMVFDAWNAVGAAIDMVRQQFGLEGVTIAWTPPTQAAPMRGNPLRLEQVVLNLLANARDALRAREDSRLIIVEGRVDSHIRLTVADNGPGIDPQRLHRIFELFYTTKGPGEGTGLGLSISMHIVNGLRGSIEAGNGLRGSIAAGNGLRGSIAAGNGLRGSIAAGNGEIGACFTVTLPVAERDPAGAGHPVEEAPADPSHSAAHLLVVDDEPLAVRYMAELLRRSGYRVSVAGDGEEALAIYAVDRADLVVTDARMPRCDGPRLIARLHDIEPGLPVIVVSGQHDVEDLIDIGRRRGEAVRILPKPVDIMELRRVIGEILSIPRTER